MSHSELANITLRQLTHAMLGLRYWTPREIACPVSDTDHEIPSAQQRSLPISPGKGDFPARKGNLYDSYRIQSDSDKRKNDGKQNTASAVGKITVASGVEITSHGTMVFDQVASHAWYFPLPWRKQEGWVQWRDSFEGRLLEEACQVVDISECASLLNVYQRLQFGFTELPDRDISVFNVQLPASVKEIITFTGLTWQHLAGDKQPEDSVIIDWHGREVRVRCLPHPYYCLLEASSKRALWQGLIKLKYEM